MTKTSRPILFFGNERLATGVSTTAPTLSRLIDEGYRIAAVVASNDNSGLSRKQRELEVAAIARAHNIPVLLPKRLRDASSDLRGFEAHMGVLVAYGKIIPQSIIDIFPAGIVNIHPSLLPLHRGPTPIESSILNNDSTTGVSIMQLTKDMDAGPVYAQKTLKLDGSETKQELAETLLKLGGDVLLKIMPQLLAGTITPQPQDDSHATYDKLIQKSDGNIDWKKPAAAIEREIRAYAIWPGSRTVLAGKDVTITKARMSSASDQKPGALTVTKRSLTIACGVGSLEIETLKPAGKQEMSASAFIAGYLQQS